MVFWPPPGESAKDVAFENGAKNTAVNAEFSLKRIESAVRQARRKFTLLVPTCVTLFEAPSAGVSSGSDKRKLFRSTVPCRLASISPATTVPHQFCVASI